MATQDQNRELASNLRHRLREEETAHRELKQAVRKLLRSIGVMNEHAAAVERLLQKSRPTQDRAG